MSDGVNITTQQMYAILLEVRDTVKELRTMHLNQQEKLEDHEERLRGIERSEISTRRIEDMEEDVRAIRADMDHMKKRLYAIPGASVLIAAAAVVITLIRTY